MSCRATGATGKPIVGQVRISELFEKTARDVGTPVRTRHRGVRFSAVSLQEGNHFFIALPICFHLSRRRFSEEVLAALSELQHGAYDR
jgi:hypothetical protein